MEPDTIQVDGDAGFRRQGAIATLAIAAIFTHLLLKHASVATAEAANLPLFAALLLGGLPLVWELLRKVWRGQFGADLLAGISIITSVLLGEYLAGTLVVLMLSGGEALEALAVRGASSVLRALAKRRPSVAHRTNDSVVVDLPLEDVRVGDLLVVLPHEICPIDGTVVDGHSVMDESYLTGEPYMMSKTPGSQVISGAVNGESVLTIRADRLAVDSRFAQIMEVMRASQQQRPRIRRLGDQLGAWYTPLAVAVGLIAWMLSGEALRFLAVMVVATPCPLLIAIPVAIIGSISLAAKRAIIIRDPVVLEQVDRCRTMILDKTGTLTYGQPRLVDQHVADGFDRAAVLALAASLEQYSKHPLAEAVIQAAGEQQVKMRDAAEISEQPGEGLSGTVDGSRLQVTSRQRLLAAQPDTAGQLPRQAAGLECVVLIDGRYAATYQFRDTPRREGASFVRHLGRQHGIQRVVMLSGDRREEVEYLAALVGIGEFFADQSPEQKLDFVRAETGRAPTIFIGDGVNDAPALMVATVGIALGQNSDVTSQAAGVVVMDSSLSKVDEFMHISRRMRAIALQSAVGGMALSLLGMLVAAAGFLPPVAGAVTQEVIDVVAVLNALRVALPPKSLVDF